MAQETNLFTFPQSVSKKDLTTYLEVSADKVKGFLSIVDPDLLIEIGWADKRIFSPAETHRIYLTLFPHIYPSFRERLTNRMIEVALARQQVEVDSPELKQVA